MKIETANQELRFKVRAGVAVVAILFGTILTPKPSDAADTVFAPCSRLKNNSTVIKNAVDRINGFHKSGEARHRIYESTRKSIDAVQWPFTMGGSPENNTYIFQSADFDGDGKVDTAVSSCGSGEGRICFLTFDRGDGRHYELEGGFMYVEKVGGHFYVAWDYVSSPALIRTGGPANDFSQYYAITRRGFVEVCKGK